MITFEHKQIFENLYGGSPFNPKDIRRWFKNAKLKLPVNVIAVELDHPRKANKLILFKKADIFRNLTLEK